MVAGRGVLICSLTKEAVANNRLDAIGADKKITGNLRTVFEGRTDAAVGKGNVGGEPLGVEHRAIGGEVFDHCLLEVVTVKCDERALKVTRASDKRPKSWEAATDRW